MKNKYYLIAVSVVLSLYLTGCKHQATMTEGFGNAVKSNTAQQVIDPQAGQDDMAPMTLGGKKAEAGLDRYYGESGEAEDKNLLEDIIQSQ